MCYIMGECWEGKSHRCCLSSVGVCPFATISNAYRYFDQGTNHCFDSDSTVLVVEGLVERSIMFFFFFMFLVCGCEQNVSWRTLPIFAAGTVPTNLVGLFSNGLSLRFFSFCFCTLYVDSVKSAEVVSCVWFYRWFWDKSVSQSIKGVLWSWCICFS